MKKLINFDDDRGSLVPLEFSDLNFTPKRIFLVKNVPVNTIRGNHAHHINQQLLICVKGMIEVSLHPGNTVVLKENEKVFIPELVWSSQKFMLENSVLLVLCSESYKKDDYIFDFDFLKAYKT